MKTSKKTFAIASIIGILGTIVGGLIVYAAITSNLGINGTASFQPETWGVQFDATSLSPVTLTSIAEVTDEPKLSTTAITGFNVLLHHPGDSVAYTFFIENTGSIDARLETYTPGAPMFTGTGDNATTDEGIVSANLQYTLKYIDDGDIESKLQDNGLTAENEVAPGDSLKAGTRVKVELKVDYPDVETAGIPENGVTISALDKALIYVMNYQQQQAA